MNLYSRTHPRPSRSGKGGTVVEIRIFKSLQGRVYGPCQADTTRGLKSESVHIQYESSYNPILQDNLVSSSCLGLPGIPPQSPRKEEN